MSEMSQSVELDLAVIGRLTSGRATLHLQRAALGIGAATESERLARAALFMYIAEQIEAQLTANVAANRETPP